MNTENISACLKVFLQLFPTVTLRCEVRNRIRRYTGNMYVAMPHSSNSRFGCKAKDNYVTRNQKIGTLVQLVQLTFFTLPSFSPHVKSKYCVSDTTPATKFEQPTKKPK